MFHIDELRLKHKGCIINQYNILLIRGPLKKSFTVAKYGMKHQSKNMFSFIFIKDNLPKPDNVFIITVLSAEYYSS